MPAYQGGTVWLQVVPSFDGTQQSIRRGVAEAFAGAGVGKAAADAFRPAEREAEKIGERAAQRLTNSFQKITQDRIKRISKDFDVLKNSLPEQEFNRIRTILADISNLDLRNVTGQAQAADGVRRLRNEFQGFLDEADRGQRQLSDPARWNLGAIRTQADEIGDSIRRWSSPDPIRVRFDRDAVRNEMQAIRDEIRRLQTDIRVGADTSNATREIAQLQARLAQLDRERVDVDVDVDTFGAMQQLRRLQAQVLATQRSGGSGGSFLALLDAGAAANSVRVFNGVLFTTVTLGPLLIPVLAGIAGGISAIGAVAIGAVFGLGALVAGLAGVGGAVQAMAELDRARREERSGAGSARDAAAERRQAVQDARSVADAQRALTRARRDGARAIQDADRQVADAERALSRAHQDAADAAEDAVDRVADARRDLARANADAARAAEDAARRVRDAEQNLTDAQADALQAQRDLNQARQQAVRDLEDLNNALDSARLSERDLEFQVEEAAVHLNVVLEDDQATEREIAKAQLRYDQAVEALEQQQLETRRLETDTAKANKAGVEGSDRVRTAKDRLNDANRRIRTAEEQLADAREAQDRQAIDNAEQLADARERVNEAIAAQREVAVDSAQRIDDAERALADARRARADAELNASEQIADAQRNLARAHQDIRLRAEEAATATDTLATAQDNLTEAMRNLSPAGAAFAAWLYSLEPLLRRLRFAAQEGLLPGLQAGLTAVIDEYGPSFIRFVGDISQVIGDLAEEFGNLLVSNPLWREFFDVMEELGPTFVRQFGQIGINLSTAFAAIVTAFAPFFAEMGEGLLVLTEQFVDWASSLEGSEALERFFAYLRESGPEVGELIANIFSILVNLFIGLAPYADDLLQSLIGFTDWLADMDPDELARLALGIGAVVLAVQALAGALSIISGVGGLIGGALKFGGAVGGAVRGAAGALRGGAAKGAAAGAAPAAAGALEGVGTAAGTAGKRFIGLLGPVGLVIGILWLVWDAASWLDDQFGILGGTTNDISRGMADAWDWLWRRGIKPVWDLISGVLDVFGQMFRVVGEIVYQVFRFIIAPAFRWLWENTIGPWWEDNIQPVLRRFGTWIKENLPDAVRAGVNLIADIWNRLLNIFRDPIRGAIEIVWNRGIIGSFNWLADRVPGMTKIDPIEIPAALYPNGKKFATGGMMPGYTPGRDVHRFVSPTAGVLELSGGEPILRPEAGRVLGKGWVDGINAAARGGGTGGVQRFLGHESHADGGFFGDVLEKIKGIGGALSNPLGFFDDVVSAALRSWGVGGMFGDIIGPMVTSVPRSLADWIGDLIFGSGGTGGRGGTPAGAMGWQLMWNLVQSQFPSAALHSAFRPGAITALGTPSYHGLGRAIDITPSMATFNWLARTFPNATELIFSPAGDRQLRNGIPTLFGEPTRGDHWDHIHWAMASGGILPTLYDNGGDVPPGLTLMANATGRVESVVTDAFMEEVRALARRRRGEDAPLVDARGSRFGSDPAEVAEELDKLRNDKMTLTGVFTESGF